MAEYKYTPADFKSDQIVKWCPGCGDHAILNAVQRAMPEVADARDVASTFNTVGQANTGDLTERGVRLLRRGGLDGEADAALLRALLQDGSGRLCSDRLSSVADQLVDRRHGSTSYVSSKSWNT